MGASVFDRRLACELEEAAVFVSESRILPQGCVDRSCARVRRLGVQRVHHAADEQYPRRSRQILSLHSPPPLRRRPHSCSNGYLTPHFHFETAEASYVRIEPPFLPQRFEMMAQACICPYCSKQFLPSLVRRAQRVCSSPDCQRLRQTDYHRRKYRFGITCPIITRTGPTTLFEKDTPSMRPVSAKPSPICAFSLVAAPRRLESSIRLAAGCLKIFPS